MGSVGFISIQCGNLIKIRYKGHVVLSIPVYLRDRIIEIEDGFYFDYSSFDGYQLRDIYTIDNDRIIQSTQMEITLPIPGETQKSWVEVRSECIY